MSFVRQYFERQHREALPVWLWLLYPACLIYGLVVSIRSSLYQVGILKSTKLPVPVISVGNLTTGGTGKTPVVIAISRYLIQHNKKVVTLSRGYGAKLPQDYARATNADYGDEAYLIQQAVPEAIVIVGRKRRDNALKAIQEFQPDVIVLDDGFQYLLLERDVNLVLVDGEQGFGNGHLLPLGPLRESLNALKRATSVVITKTCSKEQLAELMSIFHQYADPKAFTFPPIHWPFESVGVYQAQSNQEINITELKEKKLVTLCGIARPDTFVQSLNQLGIHIPENQQLVFSDHHNYTVQEIEQLVRQFPEAYFLTTEKDWMKLQSIIPTSQRKDWAYLKIEPQIADYHWPLILGPIAKLLQVGGSSTPTLTLPPQGGGDKIPAKN